MIGALLFDTEVLWDCDKDQDNDYENCPTVC
jgi:hypothetical protein